MNEKQTQARIDSRITEFHNDACYRVQLGEITPLEANELAADFADRMYRDGPWS